MKALKGSVPVTSHLCTVSRYSVARLVLQLKALGVTTSRKPRSTNTFNARVPVALLT